MRDIVVVGASEPSRVNYDVIGAHQEGSLLEFTMMGYNIISGVISVGNGKHMHLPAKNLIQYLSDGNEIYGLVLGEGNKLAVSSTLAHRQIERHGNSPTNSYSCCLDQDQALLVGISIETYQDRRRGLPVSTSRVIGYKFCMMQNIFELTPEQVVEWIENTYVPEVSLVNGSLHINDYTIIDRIREVNAKYITEGLGDDSTYIELVRPEDIVYVKQHKED